MEKHLKVLRISDQALVSEQTRLANTFMKRFRGLIGVKKLDLNSGLLISPCNSIHMWMMSVSIDAIFLRRVESQYRITKVCRALRPWALLPVSDWRASDVLELPEGTAVRLNLKEGDVLCIAS